jgi:transposase
VNRRFELTDQEWERLAPLLPAMTPKRGGRWRDHRQVLNGILVRVRSGVPLAGPAGAVWAVGDGLQAVRALADRRDLGADRGGLAHPGGCCRGAGRGRPDRRQRGAGPSARRWRPQKGLPSIQASRQQALGRSRGGLTTKLHTIGDGRGRNLVTRLTPGQDADTTQLVGLVDAVRVARPGGRGRARTRPDHLTGDKAYSSRANRAALRARHIPHTIPERDHQQAHRARRGARGGRPPAFDRERYRQRNQVERLMNRRKQFRAVATRFDKLAARYQATVSVADIFIWLRARPDRSRSDPRNTP